MWKSRLLRNTLSRRHATRLSPDEYRHMVEHSESCTSCRSAEDDFSTFLEQLAESEFGQKNTCVLRQLNESGLQERFIERARAAGIQFSDAITARQPGVSRSVLPYSWGAAALILTVVAIAVGQRVVHRTPKPQVRDQAFVLNKQFAEAQRNHELEAKLTELQGALESSRQEIRQLRFENSQMVLQIDTLNKDVIARRAENQTLKQSFTHWREISAQQLSQNETTAQLLTHTQSELEEARVRGKLLESDLGAAKAELGVLSQQLSTQAATLAREREFLVAGRDITDLMGARNLHIIDVRDADGRGKNRKSFGRIFYTERKSLIFYAYDLDESKVVKSNYSFEVWGERLGEPTSIRNLGILYTDNKDQKRWAFKVDDPQQLAEIDSVFVTLEPHQGNSQPRGGRVLFAYLGGNPNHP